MARKKSKGTELSVFKGREARLNRAIFQILTRESPLVIYDIAQVIRKQKGFKHTKYTNVSRRVKALEQQGYLEQAGSRITQPGPQGTLYQPTTRAHVAFFFNRVSPDKFIKEADEETLMAELATLTLFFGKAAEKTSRKQTISQNGLGDQD
ncbi:hypothetical protein MUP38_06565 [Candidatus Bathyarchaeota archaeon]|nr:hypothetical protein [Candidatus Bathyarchaeota archaeon]